MAQRWPSTETSFFLGVPLGHQVEKKARAPSAMLRRISSPRVHCPVRALLYCAASRHKGKWHLCGKRSRNHSTSNLRLRCKPHIVRHMRHLQADGIVRPLLWQIKLTINEGMAVARHIGSKHADLAVSNLARRTRVLPCNPA